MNENETLSITNSLELIKKQFNGTRIPSATLFYGENLTTIFKLMTNISTQLNPSTTPLIESTSENIQEQLKNVIIINTPNAIKIDIIKQLQNRIKYGADDHSKCIIIIHSVEKCTNSAKNALLKSIEEPPENTLFFLSTDNKHKISDTIKSRAQQFFIPDLSEPLAEKTNQLVDRINEKTTHLSAMKFLSKTLFEKTVFIQGLPYDTTLITTILSAWKLEIFSRWPKLTQKEHKFLEKIIEIISNIKYNLNLKLQLLAATLQMEEDDSQ